MHRHRIMVAGMLASDPFQGGATWAVLQYVLGLRALGHDVTVVDPVPSTQQVTPAVAAYFDAVTARFGLRGRAAIVAPTGEPHGMAAVAFDQVVDRADILLDLSGRWRRDDRPRRVPVRVYIDLDPGFTQLWHDEGTDVGLGGHTHHLTVGTSIGTGRSTLPTGGVDWTWTLPPVVLDHWPVRPAPGVRRLTTVANWRSYGSIERDGAHFGQKAHAFRELLGVADASPVPIAVAMSIDPGDGADRTSLSCAGWELLDGRDVTATPDRYRAFVQRSWAELGVAKTGYVVGRTGWVSDRSACYLASGRPVIAQDTGLEGALPVGCGLITFCDTSDAVAAIEEVGADYERHARGARAVAEEHLDARRVLTRLLDVVAP